MGFSTDDYIFIQQLAPIRTLADVLRPFWHVDPNPPYWRPLSDASAALDFLIWGWNGQGFHLTNFLLHLAATALVFPFSRRVLRLSVTISAITAFIFGIAASHESNLLWPAARADILVTIFTMLMLIAHEAGLVQKRRLFFILSCIAYLLALLSKENGLLALPLLMVLLELPAALAKHVNWRNSVLHLTPYIAIAVLFWIVRTHFTVPMNETEPLLSEGSHSIVAFVRNAMYGIGYALLPLDLDQATVLLREQSPWLWSLPFLLMIATFALWLRLPRMERGVYLRPILFFVIAGVVAMQSFERWRYYMPSIGLFAIAALFAADAWRHAKHRSYRVIIVMGALILLCFHLWRARAAEDNWRMAAAEVQQLKEGLKAVLNTHPSRPLKLDLLDVPAKVGSASVMLVGFPEFIRQAEAERLALPGLRYGDEMGTNLTVEKAVDIYALDPFEGFSHMVWQRLSDTSITLSAAPGSHLRFEPVIFKLNGVSRRDWKLKNGDVFDVGTNRVTVLEADGSFARAIRIENTGASWLPVLFDGRTFQALQ